MQKDPQATGPARTPAAPTASPAQVFDLRPANITAVWTASELHAALASGALDIEIRAHLDLTPLLEVPRSALHWRRRERRAALDGLAMLQVDVGTRSIRVRHNFRIPDTPLRVECQTQGCAYPSNF